MRISGKKKSVAMFATLLLCFCSALCIGIGALFHAKADSAQTLTPLYRFDFSDSENRGANTGSLNTVSATINGSAQYTTDAPKNRTALNITSAGTRQNYVSIAADAFNRESVTLAGWFKISQNTPAWSRMLTVNNQKKDTAQYSYMDVMPYGPGYANGLHINTAINNTALIGINGESDNMMQEGNEPDAGTAMPKANYTLPVYDAWTHYAYVLTPQSFKLYQNGVLLKTREGNFTASQFYSDSAMITLGATLNDGTVDFTGAFADFRVYDGALTGEQLVSEFNIDYTDLLTTKFDFESSGVSGTIVTDSVRGFTGTLMGNAQVGQDADKNSNVLMLDGNADNGKSSFKIANNTLHGHNAITISMDVFLAHDTPAYTRLFEFARTGSTALMLGANWGGTPLYIKSTLNEGNASKTSDYSIQGSYYDRWINITVTLDGSCEGRQNAVVYIDGIPVMQRQDFIYKNTLFYGNDEWMDLSFGRTSYYNDAPMKGKIDNIKIWQTVLTQKQILTETGVITIQDDQAAVNSEKEKLTVTYSDGDPSIELPTAVGEAVTVSWKSSHPAIVSATGEIIALPSDKDTVVTLTATLSRFDATATKTFNVTIKKEVASLLRAGTALENVTFPKGSYYYQLMETNLDFMMGLDKDRLLYNYRRIAGLDTKGVQSYGGTWISPESNGAGQFEAHYVTALAKASRTMPDYRYHSESVTDRLTYMVTEMKKCRDAFAAKYPNESGYFGAITTENFDVLTENRVDLSDGTQAWVPWYFNHKNMEAMLDVYWYAPTQELRNIGKDILSGLADWSYGKMNPLSEAKRNEVLKFREYGGMAEVLWQTYAVTGKEEHRKAATYFEEKDFLDKIYNNQDALKGLHANTTIPKFLGCAAAYEVTGKEYYKTICVNAYNMIMKRTYANGGTGDQEWWYTDAENTPESYESAETCCSYNMLKLADYLYRWTGDKTYADYFENTYTNHILASMAPDSGLKTYLTNTEFGYYKIYHTVDKSFWCCACTGMESFAKLPYGIYYTDITESAAAPVVRVNMFYPSEYKVSDTITVTQSGNFYADQKTLFTVKGSGQFTLALRLPDWANGNITIKINGAVQSVTATNGYYEINHDWSDGDTVEYSVPFSFRLVALKGSKNKNAIFYGPLLFVADLGDDDVHDVQESQVNFGKPYTGDIGNKIVFEEDWQNNTQVVADADGNISFVLHTRNQGDITFRPFNQVIGIIVRILVSTLL